MNNICKKEKKDHEELASMIGPEWRINNVEN